MKLQDYIHYYIGCDVITTDDNEMAELVGVSDDNAHLVHKGSGSYGTSDISGVKPLLRGLYDMTEEEALHIGKLSLFDRDMKYPNSDYTSKKVSIVDNPSAYSVAINNDWYEMEIRIGFNSGNIWRVGHNAQERVYNQPAIFHYLLKQQFDLFNLIDAGLAIDAKTLG